MHKYRWDCLLAFVEKGANGLDIRVHVAAGHLKRCELCAAVLGVHVSTGVHQHAHRSSQILLCTHMQRGGPWESK